MPWNTMELYNDLSISVCNSRLLHNYGENNTWITEKIKKWYKTICYEEVWTTGKPVKYSLILSSVRAGINLFLQNLEHYQT